MALRFRLLLALGGLRRDACLTAILLLLKPHWRRKMRRVPRAASKSTSPYLNAINLQSDAAGIATVRAENWTFAMDGVVNLNSRRPGSEQVHEFLNNPSTLFLKNHRLIRC